MRTLSCREEPALMLINIRSQETFRDSSWEENGKFSYYWGKPGTRNVLGGIILGTSCLLVSYKWVFIGKYSAFSCIPILGKCCEHLPMLFPKLGIKKGTFSPVIPRIENKMRTFPNLFPDLRINWKHFPSYFSNALIIHMVISQSECPILVRCMHLDTQ